MRSASTPRAALLALLSVLMAGTHDAARGAEAPLHVVGLVPSRDARITQALAQGARLACAEARREGGPSLVLRVGAPAGRWGNEASAAVDLIRDEGAVALVAPPERRAAHLLAQVGTRTQVPILSTSPAPTVTRAGTYWVFGVVPEVDDAPPRPPAWDAESVGGARFAAAFRARYGREPDGWHASGYDAVRALALGLARCGRPGRPLVDALAGLEGVEGALGPLRFEGDAHRRSTRREGAGAESPSVPGPAGRPTEPPSQAGRGSPSLGGTERPR